MTGIEMMEIRQRLQMTRLQLAREIGYTGTDRNDITRIRKYEGDKQQVPLYIARLVWLIGQVHELRGSEPEDLLEGSELLDPSAPIPWPRWPGYEYDHTSDDALTAEAEDGVFN